MFILFPLDEACWRPKEWEYTNRDNTAATELFLSRINGIDEEEQPTEQKDLSSNHLSSKGVPLIPN